MTQRRFILGIVGDSAAGKTTLTRGIAQILGKENVTVIQTDDYHRYDRTQRSELGISALHPDANTSTLCNSIYLCCIAVNPFSNQFTTIKQVRSIHQH